MRGAKKQGEIAKPKPQKGDTSSMAMAAKRGKPISALPGRDVARSMQAGGGEEDTGAYEGEEETEERVLTVLATARSIGVGARLERLPLTPANLTAVSRGGRGGGPGLCFLVVAAFLCLPSETCSHPSVFHSFFLG
jgi:hypothetical protein